MLIKESLWDLKGEVLNVPGLRVSVFQGDADAHESKGMGVDAANLGVELWVVL